MTVKTNKKAMELGRKAELVLGEYLVHFLEHVGSSAEHLRACDDTPFFCLTITVKESNRLTALLR